MSTKTTTIHLAAALRALGRSTPGINEMIREAEANEYHDFKNTTYACGKIVVATKLAAEAALPTTPKGIRAALMEIRRDVVDGEFDETADADDIEMMKADCPRELWPALGLETHH